MATALDVANYFLNRVDRESGDLITQLKLYKLVYYAQAWSLVFRRNPLFDGDIQAWVHGPVPVQLRSVYQDFGTCPIPPPQSGACNSVNLDPDEVKILEMVWDVYGELSASKLWRLTHLESPWLRARQGLAADIQSQTVISLSDMQSYYQNFVEINSDEKEARICLKAISENKDEQTNALIPLEDGEGSVYWVDPNNLYSFLSNFNAERENIPSA